MPLGRKPIPAELERALFIEAGYRCAIPTCRAVAPLVIEHIEEWAKVREHKFENMIVLCANCHGLKGNKPRQLDRKALRQYKANLGLLNHRYGEYERRLLEDFARNPEPNVRFLHGTIDLLLSRLVADKYLARNEVEGMYTEVHGMNGNEPMTWHIPALVVYSLTPAGQELVENWLAARPLPI